MSSDNALRTAYDKGLDLVLISPNAQPPVCRIVDYGRYRYEQEKREKEAKKKQQTVEVKEVQLSCRIDTHDFETKAKHAKKFLESGNKVRVVMRFRGREMAHTELGNEVLKRIEESIKEYGVVEKQPVMEGRFMYMMVAPIKKEGK